MEDFHRKPRGSWEGKTYILIPYKIRPEWIWIQRLNQLNRSGMVTNIVQSSHYRIDTARNLLVEDALRKGATTIIFLDADIIPPVNGIERLLSTGYPIVSGLYYVSKPGFPKLPCAWVWRRKKIKGKRMWAYFHLSPDPVGFTEVDAVGMGFVRIEREVFEKIPSPWFYYEDEFRDGKRVNRVSEDFYFCKKARKAGYKIVLDTTLRCQHLSMGITDDEGKYDVSNIRALEKA